MICVERNWNNRRKAGISSVGLLAESMVEGGTIVSCVVRPLDSCVRPLLWSVFGSRSEYCKFNLRRIIQILVRKSHANRVRGQYRPYHRLHVVPPRADLLDTDNASSRSQASARCRSAPAYVVKYSRTTALTDVFS